MGLRINVNIASLIAQQSLRANSRRLDAVYRELASGERINRAGDDAAGLAISQILRSQVRSINQASRNAADGQSVLDTAEAALANVQNTVQRIRELAIQAANGTLSTDDRVAIQDEIDALLEEIDRIAETTQFNRHPLLDGTFINQRIQVGITASNFLPVSIPDMHAAILGQQAVVTGANAVSALPIAGTGDLIINGVTIPATSADGLSFVNPNASAIAKAEAINSVAAQTDVNAEVEAAVLQVAGASIGAVSLDGTANALFINGVNIGAVDVTAGDSTGALADAINGHSGETGVTASVASGGELVLTAEDGRNFQVTTTGSVADELGLATADGDLTAQAVSGGITLRSSENIEVSGTDIGLVGFTAGQVLTVPDLSNALANLSVTTQDSAEEAIASADAAISQLNRVRASLGAIANRLQDAQDDLAVMSENLQASDARIRDTDFAEATARATQEQILQQAATAILAQANLLPQMALRLLEG